MVTPVRSPSRPLRLGLTGGLGSGKSTVARRLERRGVPVFDADAVAKGLYATDADLRASLVEAFGPATFRPDGTLDRPRLARIVFGDADALARLNALVHPRVFAAWQAFVAARADAPIVVHESAILFESGGDRHVDAVVWVDAPREVRIERAMARDSAPRAAVEARLAHQTDPDAARQRAAFVLDNGGDESALDAQVDALLAWARLRHA